MFTTELRSFSPGDAGNRNSEVPLHLEYFYETQQSINDNLGGFLHRFVLRSYLLFHLINLLHATGQMLRDRDDAQLWGVGEAQQIGNLVKDATETRIVLIEMKSSQGSWMGP